MYRFCSDSPFLASCVQMPNTEVWIEVSCMRTTMVSSRGKSKEGCCTWYEELQMATGGDMSVEMPEDLDQCADVFVYLCTSKGRVAFRRYTPRYLMEKVGGWNARPHWHNLNECLALDAFDECVWHNSLTHQSRNS